MPSVRALSAARCSKPKKNHYRYCSIACSHVREARRVDYLERPCTQCGSLFKPKTKTSQHCSKVCVSQWFNAKCRRLTRVDHPERACAICGTMFKPRTVRGKFCGKECKVHGSKRRKVDHPERACDRCGAKFKPKAGHSRYCGLKCSDARFSAGIRQSRSSRARLHSLWQDVQAYKSDHAILLKPMQDTVLQCELWSGGGERSRQRYSWSGSKILRSWSAMAGAVRSAATRRREG